MSKEDIKDNIIIFVELGNDKSKDIYESINVIARKAEYKYSRFRKWLDKLEYEEISNSSRPARIVQKITAPTH